MSGFTAYVLTGSVTHEWSGGPGTLQVGNRDPLAAITVEVVRDDGTEDYEATDAGDGLSVELTGVRQFVLSASSYPATILFVFGSDPSAILEPSPIVQVGNTINIGTIVGTVTIAGAVTITGPVDVSGSVVDVSGSVVGVASVSGTVNVSGSVVVSSITAPVTVSGNVDATVSGTVGVSAVAGTVTVAGSVTVSNTLTVTGTVNVGTISGSITIAAGSVDIGTVTGSVAVGPQDFTFQGSGHKSTAVAGTRVALKAGSTPASVVMLKADQPNATTLYVGKSNVTADETEGTGGWQLEPGDSITFPATDLANIYIVSPTGGAGDGVSILYWLKA